MSDWLADYAALEPAELRSFVADHEHNHEISHALFTIINERAKYPEVSGQMMIFLIVWSLLPHL